MACKIFCDYNILTQFLPALPPMPSFLEKNIINIIKKLKHILKIKKINAFEMR